MLWTDLPGCEPCSPLHPSAACPWPQQRSPGSCPSCALTPSSHCPSSWAPQCPPTDQSAPPGVRLPRLKWPLQMVSAYWIVDSAAVPTCYLYWNCIFSLSELADGEYPCSVRMACGSRTVNEMQLGVPVKLHHDKADSSSTIQEAWLYTFNPPECARRCATGRISQWLSVTCQ